MTIGANKPLAPQVPASLEQLLITWQPPAPGRHLFAHFRNSKRY
jgi:hypothetical protein